MLNTTNIPNLETLNLFDSGAMHIEAVQKRDYVTICHLCLIKNGDVIPLRIRSLLSIFLIAHADPELIKLCLKTKYRCKKSILMRTTSLQSTVLTSLTKNSGEYQPKENHHPQSIDLALRNQADNHIARDCVIVYSRGSSHKLAAARNAICMNPAYQIRWIHALSNSSSKSLRDTEVFSEGECKKVRPSLSIRKPMRSQCFHVYFEPSKASDCCRCLEIEGSDDNILLTSCPRIKKH